MTSLHLTFVISHKGGGIVAVKERIDIGSTLPARWRPAPHVLSSSISKEDIFQPSGHYGGMNSVKNALEHQPRPVYSSY